jgi:hypothetical protein
MIEMRSANLSSTFAAVSSVLRNPCARVQGSLDNESMNILLRQRSANPDTTTLRRDSNADLANMWQP